MSGLFAGLVFDGLAQGQQLRSRVPEGVQANLDIEFAKVGQRSLKLDFYIPRVEPGQNLPVVVWIFPGAWMSGSRKGGPAVALSEHGYAVASIDYRLSQEALFPAQIEDCKAAVRWLRANAEKYHLDPDRIGAWGSSAGGHLAALLGTSGGVAEFDVGDNLQSSSRVQAVCDWFGPSDFTQMAAHKPDGSRFDYGTAGSPEGRLVGGPINEHLDLVAKANPVTFLSADDPPFLIAHGDQDNVVPYHQSQLLHEALLAKGLKSKFQAMKDSGHGTGGFTQPAAFEQVLAFFNEHLQTEKQAAGAPEVAQDKTGGSRAALVAQVDRFLDAMVAHNPAPLGIPVAVRVTENGQPARLGEGIWKSATEIKSKQYFVDPTAGQVACAALVAEGENLAICVVRLKVVDESIAEVETIVSRRGDHALFAPTALATPKAVYDEVLAAERRTSREKMVAAANAYFDGLQSHSGDNVPFDPACTRTENGVQTAGSSGRGIAAGMRNFTYIPRVRDRRFPIVDVERGVVFSVIMFDMPGNVQTAEIDGQTVPLEGFQRSKRSLLLAEVFKVVDGKLLSIDAYMVNRPLDAPTGW